MRKKKIKNEKQNENEEKAGKTLFSDSAFGSASLIK
jgi:hypothetical protein